MSHHLQLVQVVECRAGSLDWTAVTTNQPILLPTGDTLQYGLTLHSPSHELTQEEGSPAQTVVWTLKCTYNCQDH